MTSIQPQWPSLLQLGLQRRALLIEHDLADESRTGEDPNLAVNVMSLIEGREQALLDLILSLPAATLGDVAVQLDAALSIAEVLKDFEVDQRDREKCTRQIHRALLSAIPIVAREAGIELTRISDPSLRHIAAREFATSVAEAQAAHQRVVDS